MHWVLTAHASVIQRILGTRSLPGFPCNAEVMWHEGRLVTACPLRAQMRCISRAAFVASEGWVLVSGDYRQQELRVMAHLSGDAKLCAILRDRGDPFRLIAADWHGLQPAQVSILTLFY